MVSARPNRAEHFLRFGGGEDELHVGRRLLDHLQQGVETLLGDHVGFVDDVDLVAAVDRCEEGPLSQIPGLVDATVGRRVDLDDIDAAGTPTGEISTGLALAAGLGCGAFSAVEAARQDACARGLAATAGAGEKIGMVDPVVHQRPLQRLGDLLLADDLGEGLWAVAAIQRQRGLGPLDMFAGPAAGVDSVHQGCRRRRISDLYHCLGRLLDRGLRAEKIGTVLGGVILGFGEVVLE